MKASLKQRQISYSKVNHVQTRTLLDLHIPESSCSPSSRIPSISCVSCCADEAIGFPTETVYGLGGTRTRGSQRERDHTLEKIAHITRTRTLTFLSLHTAQAMLSLTRPSARSTAPRGDPETTLSSYVPHLHTPFTPALHTCRALIVSHAVLRHVPHTRECTCAGARCLSGGLQ